MSNGFTIDTDKAYETMAHSVELVEGLGGAVLYVVACQHDPSVDGVGSHGGEVVATAKHAVDGAVLLNKESAEDHPCRYVPMVVGISARTAQQMTALQADQPPDDQIGGGGVNG